MRKFVYLFLFLGMFSFVSSCKNNNEETTKITITYDTNGGEAIDSEIVDPSMPYLLKTPKKEGYDFIGWELNGYSFTGDLSGVKADITLVAKWESNGKLNEEKFTVTFNSNGGSSVSPQEIIKGSKSNKPVDPIKDGYTFIGWYDGNSLFVFDTPITTNKNLKAEWKLNGETIIEYIITIDVNGSKTTQKVQDGKLIADLGERTLSGHKFIEWRLNGVKYDFSKPVTKDFTLVAYFEKEEELENYEVKFVVDGSIIKTVLVVEGDAVAEITAPAKENKNFNGWYLNDNKFNFSTKITSSIELVAKYADIKTDINYSEVQGFAKGNVTLPTITEGHADYRVVTNELEFAAALKEEDKNGKTAARVIEIRADMNMGDKELQRKYGSVPSGIKPNNSPSKHPTLIETGVSKMNIQNRKDLLIYSKTGHTIKHIAFVIKNCTNVTIRNLEFDELWEWDDTGSEYDTNDWDYFTLEFVNGVWFDHITMRKSYDGLIDLKVRDSIDSVAKNVTISYSKFIFEYDNPFIKTQFEYLEANKNSNPYYKKMRDAGMSMQEIMDINSSQKKGFLVGQSKKTYNYLLGATFHNTYVKNLMERFPRVRGGNAHVYNCIVDSVELSNTIKHSRENYAALFSDPIYDKQLLCKMLITTENSAVMLENSIVRGIKYPVRNNQNDKEYLQYSGKYKVLNSIYEFEDIYFKGGDLEEGSPFVSDTVKNIIPFSWNNMDELPYTYTLIEVENLQSYFDSSIVGVTNNYDLIR